MTGEDVFAATTFRLAKTGESSGVSFVSALNTAVEALFLRLWARRSDIVKKNLDIGTEIDPFNLPSDFRGLAEDPFLVSSDGSVILLAPVPTGNAALMHGETGTPKFYRLAGRAVQLFPAPEQDYDMHGEYFACPTALTFTSILPWDGIFDGLIVEAVVEASRFGGLTALLANQQFIFTMDQALDAVLSSRSTPSPRRSAAHFF